jgi:hypothetical protein
MLAVKQDAAPRTSLRLSQSRVRNAGEGIRLHHHNNISSVYDKFLPVDSEKAHSRAVTKHYLAAENSLEDGYWDAAMRETPYYEEDISPNPPFPEEKGDTVGEFDVLLLNYDDKTAFYKEVKTNPNKMGYAEDQLERAEDHFEDTDWDIITYSVLE